MKGQIVAAHALGKAASTAGRDMEIVDAFLAACDGAESTRATYRYSLSRYVGWLEERGLALDRTGPEHVVAFRDDMLRAGSPRTARNYLVAVRMLYKWIEERTGYPSPAAHVRLPKVGDAQARDALDEERAKELLELPADTLSALRDQAIASLMVRRGLRGIEVSRADMGDLRDVMGRRVLYVQGKGRDAKDAPVVVGESCAADIDAWLSARADAGVPTGDAEPLFCSLSNRNAGQRLTRHSITRIVKARLALIGVDDPRVTAHSLRHTAVTLSLEGGASVQEAQQMARHRRITTTMVYAHNLAALDDRAGSAVDGMLDS